MRVSRFGLTYLFLPRPRPLFPRSLYHLREIVKGHIDFILVRIKMKCMEIAIVRKESVGMREFASVNRVGSRPPQLSSVRTTRSFPFLSTPLLLSSSWLSFDD